MPPRPERAWVHEVVRRDAGAVAVSDEVVYQDESVTVAFVSTTAGSALAVRTPRREVAVRLPVHAREPRADEPAPGPAPTGRIEALPGVEPFLADLAAAGFTSGAALVVADPTVVSQATGAPTTIVKRWQATLDLLDLPGIEPREAALLAAAGVDSLADLGRRVVPALLAETNRRAEAEGHEPFYEETVRTWIEEAHRRTSRTSAARRQQA